MSGEWLALGTVAALALAGRRRGSQAMVHPADLEPAEHIVVRLVPRWQWRSTYEDLDLIEIDVRGWRPRGRLRLIRTRWGVWEVETIEADPGYGPLLYDVALEIAQLDGALGVTPDRSGVSPAAEAVWAFYNDKRPDVKSRPLPSDYPDRNKHTLRHRPTLDRVYSKARTPTLDALAQARKLTLPPQLSMAGSRSRIASGSRTAVAKRQILAHGHWRSVPAKLTEGHATEPDVKWAMAIVAANPAGRSLGRGNFGVTTEISTDRGPMVLKLPVTHDIHGRWWKPEDLRQWFMHEAGVANELRAAGETWVPWTVFVDLPGRFALVREYGEPVPSLTRAEFAEVERGLHGLEERTRWQVDDDLLLLRRSNGSLFVGDVGIWSSPHERWGSPPRRRPPVPTLPTWLRKLGAQAVDPSFRDVPSWPEMIRSVRYVEEMRDNSFFYDRGIEDLRASVARRQKAGLPIPPQVTALLASVPA